MQKAVSYTHLVMNVAASLESCRTTLLLAGHYDWMYAALGVHPSGTAELD